MLKAVLGLLLLSNVSCTTTEPATHDLRERYILNSVDDQLPPNLWSPRRRTSASYYHYLVADISMMRGDLGVATENYNASYALLPNSFTGSKLVASHALSGNKADSLAESRKMVLLYPKSSRLRVLYGDVLFSNGELEKAAEEFEKAIKFDSSNEQAYTSIISVYANLKKFKKAQQFAEMYKKNLSSSANAWLADAKIKLNLKKFKSALKSIETANDMQPSNANIIMVYAYCLEKNKQSEKAISYYEKLFRIVPNNMEIAGKLVSLYKEIGGLEAAYDVLDGISNRLSKTALPVELQKVFILWELKKYKNAIEVAEALIGEFPEKDQVKYLLGYSYLLATEENKALDIFLKISKGTFLRASAIVYGSDIYRKKGDINEATKLVEELKLIEDLKPSFVSYASDYFARLKNYPKAIEFLDFGYQRFPKSYRFKFLKGVYQEKIGELDAAINTMKELIELSPDYSAALNFLGYVYAERGIHLEEAKDYLERAIAKEPENGFYLDSLGWVYFKLEDYKKAEEYLLMAVKYQPSEGVIYEHLAEVEIVNKNYDKAISYFEKALKTRLNEADRTRIEKRYNETKGRYS